MAEKRKRLKWIEYFFDIVETVASRATCDTQVEGCIIIREYRPIATGYSGSMPGEDHCDDVGHCFDAIARLGEKDVSGAKTLDSKVYRVKCARAVNAVTNAIAEAARHGISLEGSDLFCTKYPGPEEAKLIVLAGIDRIYYEKECDSKKCMEYSREIFTRGDVSVFQKGETEYVGL